MFRRNRRVSDQYDGYFSDIDDAALDKIESLSPIKSHCSDEAPSPPSSPSKRRREPDEYSFDSDEDDDGNLSASPLRHSSPRLSTPRKKRKSPVMDSGGPTSAVRMSMSKMTVNNTPRVSAVARRLFQEPSMSSRRTPKPPGSRGKNPSKGKQAEPIAISSDESDGQVEQDEDEVLTDVESSPYDFIETDKPFHASVISLESNSSGSSHGSGWSLPPTKSFLAGESDRKRTLSRSLTMPYEAPTNFPDKQPEMMPPTNPFIPGESSHKPTLSRSFTMPYDTHPKSPNQVPQASSVTYGLSPKKLPKFVPADPTCPGKSRRLAAIDHALQEKNRENLLPSDDDVFVTPFASSSTASSSSVNSPPDLPSNINPMDALEAFVNGPLGSDLPVCIIAHDLRVQNLLDMARISWGVQYELARGISRGLWKWSDVELKIDKLKGSNTDAGYKVVRTMLEAKPKAGVSLAVWEELDREQAAIIENKQRGLGLMGEWKGCANWYGGQVQQIARVVKSSGGKFKVQLERLETRRSYRLARYLGSRRILQIKMPDEMMMKQNREVKQFFKQKFVLCGRVYVPLYSKDNGVYAVEVGEDWERRADDREGDCFRKSLGEIIRWHNDLTLNCNQPISKWVTRFALAFSNSVPILEFEEENINSIDDIYPAGWPRSNEKTPAEMILTDGCGLINEAALRKIAEALNLNASMTAVQGRIQGGKGLWIRHPDDKDDEPRIWIRKSQKKISHSYPLDRSLRIFDLLTISRPSASISLTKQSILNVWFNGVSEEVLIGLMVDGLKESVEPLMKWHGPRAMEMLWSEINMNGSVWKTRLVRMMAGLSRALGLQAREWGHEDIGVEEHSEPEALVKDMMAEDFLAYQIDTGCNEVSGTPLASNESAMALLQAGFRPDQMKELREKIKWIVKETIARIVDKFTIPITLSSSSFVIPDPLGVLELGEVYYRSSAALVDPETKVNYNVVTGPVLVGRYPVRLPSDIQKVVAVDKPELARWSDVLIVSIKGDFSFASLTAGGDYDGDEDFIIFDKRIVEPFQNKPLSPMPPGLMEDNFAKQVEMVADFAHRVSILSPQEAQLAFQDVLLLGLNIAQVGLYSGYHDYAIWKYGYDHAKTIRLAYIFNVVLDSSKTGHRLKPGIWESDKSDFGGTIPEDGEDAPNGTRPFIFHQLQAAGKKAAAELEYKYDQIAGVDDNWKDRDILVPYDKAADHAKNYLDKCKNDQLYMELKAIYTHVKCAYEEWRRVVAALRAKREREATSPKKRTFKKRNEPDPMLRVAQMFHEELPEDSVIFFPNVREIKASYAYHLNGSFALAVAFRDLCDIKAHMSKGGIAPTIRSFDEAKTIPSLHNRLLMNLKMSGVEM